MLNSRGRPPYLRTAGLAWSLLPLVTIPPAGFAGKVLLAATLLGCLSYLTVVAVVNMAISLYYDLIPVTETYLKATLSLHALPNRSGYLAASRSVCAEP